MFVVGIDNGTTGAVAVIDDRDSSVEFFDTPTFTVEKPNLRKGGKSKMRSRTVYDEDGMAKIIGGIHMKAQGEGQPLKVFIEIAQAAGPKRFNRATGEMEDAPQGAASMLSVGTGFGIWLGALAAFGVARERIHPATWKAALMRDASKGKDADRQKAIQLFPKAADKLALKKHHNRADALLIAECGRRRFG